MTKPVYPRPKLEYEKAEIDTWIEGNIAEIQERLNKDRKYKDADTGEWETKEVEEVRFVFLLQGYKFKHYSRWMTRSLNEKSNLCKKYLKKLCLNVNINKPVDLDLLKGLKVKTMWDEDEGKDGQIYQHVSNIKPLGEGRNINIELPPESDDIDKPPKDKSPF